MEEVISPLMQKIHTQSLSANLEMSSDVFIDTQINQPIQVNTELLDIQDSGLLLKLKTVLHEKNLPLLKSVIDVMGPEFAVNIANQVADIQSSGGIKSADGVGFRTPGGIFFQLVKKSTKLEVRKQIFEPVQKESKKRCKERKKTLSMLRRLKTSDDSKPLELHHTLSDMTRKLNQEKTDFHLSPSILRF